MVTVHEYAGEDGERSAVLEVPFGYDPPPEIKVPLTSTVGSGYEVFTLIPKES